MPPTAKMSPITFKSAIQLSIVAPFAENEFIVPQGRFLSKKWAAVEERVAQQMNADHFVRLQSLFVALEPDFLKKAVHNDPRTRGLPWEQCVVYAMFVRYLLNVWAGKSTSDGWVPLERVCPNVRQSEFEINLSSGIIPCAVTKEASGHDACLQRVACGTHGLWWNRAFSAAHHDGYLTARRANRQGDALLIALQIRHGDPKTEDEIEAQLRRSKKQSEQVAMLLLCYPSATLAVEKECNPTTQVVDCSLITHSSSVWLLSPGHALKRQQY
jgi:hypothetical protein